MGQAVRVLLVCVLTASLCAAGWLLIRDGRRGSGGARPRRPVGPTPSPYPAVVAAPPTAPAPVAVAADPPRPAPAPTTIRRRNASAADRLALRDDELPNVTRPLHLV